MIDVGAFEKTAASVLRLRLASYAPYLAVEEFSIADDPLARRFCVRVSLMISSTPYVAGSRGARFELACDLETALVESMYHDVLVTRVVEIMEAEIHQKIKSGVIVIPTVTSSLLVATDDDPIWSSAPSPQAPFGFTRPPPEDLPLAKMGNASFANRFRSALKK